MAHPTQMPGRVITRAEEYAGETAIRIAATQLGSEYTATDARRVVTEWCSFFESGPSAIQSLAFTSRTPKRLFASLRSQTQLTSLAVKWGDYDDLRPLEGMGLLHELWLGGASALTSLAPLSALVALDRLTIDGLKRVRDLSPLGELTNLTSLEIGGDWMAPRIAHVDSIAFLTRLTKLRELVLHTLVVDDRDYSPLLSLTNLALCRVHRARGMRPAHADLAAAIPALEPILDR